MSDLGANAQNAIEALLQTAREDRAASEADVLEDRSSLKVLSDLRLALAEWVSIKRVEAVGESVLDRLAQLDTSCVSAFDETTRPHGSRILVEVYSPVLMAVRTLSVYASTLEQIVLHERAEKLISASIHSVFTSRWARRFAAHVLLLGLDIASCIRGALWQELLTAVREATLESADVATVRLETRLRHIPFPSIPHPPQTPPTVKAAAESAPRPTRLRSGV